MLQLKAMQLHCHPKLSYVAWCFLCLALVGWPAKLEDRIAAVVNGEVILLSQLKFEARLNLLRAGASLQALEQISPDSWLALLDMVIAHRLWAAANEKTELSIEQLSSVALITEQLKTALGSEADYQQFLQKHDMDSADVLAILERIVRAESNLQAKVRLRAQPNELEIQKAHAASPELSEAQVKTKLYEDKFKLLSKQELEAQRKKADVRILLKFGHL